LIHKERHSVEQDLQLSTLYNSHSKNLKKARHFLRELRQYDGYDTDSLEVLDAKKDVAVWKEKKESSEWALQAHSSRVEALKDPTATVAKVPDDVIEVDNDKSSSSSPSSHWGSNILELSDDSSVDLDKGPTFSSTTDKENAKENTESPDKKKQRVSQESDSNNDDLSD